MLEFFRDGIWQFIGAFLTVAVPFATWWFGIRIKEKSLIYDVVVIVPLLTIAEEVKGKIKVFYEDKPVENLYIVILELYNNGRKSILPEHFLDPIRFVFSKGSKILTTEVINSTPIDLKSKIIVNIEVDSFTIDPTLINQNDKMKFKVLVENSERRPYAFPEARIIDIHEVNPKPSLTVFEFILALCLFMGGFIWMYIMLVTHVTTVSGWPFFFMTVIPMFVLIASSIWIIVRRGTPMLEEDKYIDAT